MATGLIQQKSPLVLMISGGSDSVALLHLTKALSADSQPLRVFHLNHLLRGDEADADEHFVVELCALLAFDCTVKRVDVAATAAATGESVEQAGRRIRYELANAELAALCKSSQADVLQGHICTAHTAEDRAETLLQRLIVGGGGSSLASIPLQNGSLVRPLLFCTRDELQHWLLNLNVSVDGFLWREDSTNANTAYSRAFVRHELLPLLATRNPRIVESLNRSATVLADESLYLDEQAQALLPLHTESFAFPLPLLRRAIYLACRDAIDQLAPDARITFDHIELIASQGSRAGFACQIPGGIEVRNVLGKITFTKAKPPQHDPRTHVSKHSGQTHKT